jgi:hypothetical protein
MLKQDDYHEFECKICLENKIEVITPCNHHFCKDCIYRWYEIKKTCPICRTEITFFNDFAVLYVHSYELSEKTPIDIFVYLAGKITWGIYHSEELFKQFIEELPENVYKYIVNLVVTNTYFISEEQFMNFEKRYNIPLKIENNERVIDCFIINSK